jgi:hypothetical protein
MSRYTFTNRLSARGERSSSGASAVMKSSSSGRNSRLSRFTCGSSTGSAGSDSPTIASTRTAPGRAAESGAAPPSAGTPASLSDAGAEAGGASPAGWAAGCERSAATLPARRPRTMSAVRWSSIGRSQNGTWKIFSK